MVTTLALILVFTLKSFAISDTQVEVEFKLSKSELAQISEAEGIQFSFEAGKTRSCKNNVTGFDILVNDRLCGSIYTGEPSLNPKTATHTIVWSHGSPRLKTVQQALKESNKLKLRPIFNDGTTDGCYSFSGRSFKISVEKVE